ncbi:MAG: spondin domain-containing protein [Acidimicrobiia bacterium]|nr:spondin domain-containing protein [Acidimicrobiia bacterium]
MNTTRKTRTIAAAAVALAGAAAIVPATVDATHGGGSSTSTYRITVENLTPAGSQPLSPVGTVVHHRRADVWSPGQPATAAVAAVAEDAGLPIFVETYAQTPGVRSAGVGGAAPIAPGAAATFDVEARPGDRLSLVSMLVNTNDAFTGLDAVRLGRRQQEFHVRAYDAGTEANNEDAAFIPGPVGGNPGVRDPEGGVIRHHDGLVGRPGGIDPEVYGWDDPVARITVERVD